MKRFGLIAKIIVLTIFIVAAVVMSGFMVYSSLSQIVNSIYREALPDYKLVVIKNITLDLSEIQNSIELYTYTKEKTYLTNYDNVKKRLNDRVSMLDALSDEEDVMLHWNDSIKNLVETKLLIWEEIKQIRTVKNYSGKKFDELYSMLEKKEIDTVQVEVVVDPPPPKGFFKKLFGKKDTAIKRIDTTFVERTVENEAIRAEIEQLETDIKQREQKKNKRELQLIEQNIVVTGKLNHLVAQFEEAERDSLIEKTNEADRLATETYNRILTFTLIAVVFLFIVIFVVFRNLRKERAYQRVLKKATAEAESLAHAKEGFMATVSHEMRTPVNAIYGLSEQLMHDKTNAKVREKLAVLSASAKHLKNIVTDILDFSKIQANKLQLEEVDFSPRELIAETLNLHKPDAGNKAIELHSKIENELPPALFGDPLRLKQILINIIGNAIKFTDKGSVTLKVKSQITNDANCILYFWVTDTGIGISETNLENIFEEFVQVESEHTRKFSGTGLGLAIVKKLVQLQAGDISITSKRGEGTTVAFQIPYKVGNPKHIKRQTIEDLFVPDPIKKQNVLVVDDEEFNRYLVRVIFDKWGVEYHEAQNGEEAVRKALENDYDIILMDIRMPKLNGIEASKLILEKKPEAEIIAIAAVNGEVEIQQCYDAGMKSFLKKPFSEADLLNVFMEVLDGRSQELNETESSDEFNLDELEGLAGGDNDFFKEMIQIFIRSSKSGFELMELALKEEKWSEISEAAHKMAPPCKHIGAAQLYDLVKQLENNTRKQTSTDTVYKLVQTIGNKIERINKKLAHLIEEGLPNE